MKPELTNTYVSLKKELDELIQMKVSLFFAICDSYDPELLRTNHLCAQSYIQTWQVNKYVHQDERDRVS